MGLESSRLRLRVQVIGAGVWVTYLLCLALTGWLVVTWDRPYRETDRGADRCRRARRVRRLAAARGADRARTLPRGLLRDLERRRRGDHLRDRLSRRRADQPGVADAVPDARVRRDVVPARLDGRRRGRQRDRRGRPRPAWAAPPSRRSRPIPPTSGSSSSAWRSAASCACGSRAWASVTARSWPNCRGPTR